MNETRTTRPSGEASAAHQDGANDLSTPTFPHRGYTWAPLAVWLAAQLLILLVPASQLKLADEFPRPAESMALHEMMAGQMIVLALMFPFLLRTPSVSLAIAASSWPFLLLAGVLASTPGQRIVGCAAYLTLWIVVLATWRSLLRSGTLQMVGVAVASALSLGMPLLAYLREEFSSNELAPGEWLDPHLGWKKILLGDATDATAWAMPAALLAIAVAILAVTFIWRRQRDRAVSAASPVSPSP